MWPSAASTDRARRWVVYRILVLRSSVQFRHVLVALVIPLLVFAPTSTLSAPFPAVDSARAAMVPNGHFISGWGAGRSGGRSHQGEDIAAPRGSPIYAPTTLTIASTGWDALGGWTVFGHDAHGRKWYFAHLHHRSTVRVGSVVRPGDVIGAVGTSGNARGTTPHLHYQVSWPDGAWGNPVDVLGAVPAVRFRRPPSRLPMSRRSIPAAVAVGVLLPSAAPVRAQTAHS